MVKLGRHNVKYDFSLLISNFLITKINHGLNFIFNYCNKLYFTKNYLPTSNTNFKFKESR